MNLRETLNNNSALVTIGAVVLLVVALAAIVFQMDGSRGGQVVDLYYYDMNDGTIFVGPSNVVPPIDAPSGPYNDQQGGVRAVIFACGECGDLAGKTVAEIEAQGGKIAYLERYTPEAKAAIENPDANEMNYELTEGGQLVAEPGSNSWYQVFSQQGQQVQERGNIQCPDGERPVFCRPE